MAATLGAGNAVAAAAAANQTTTTTSDGQAAPAATEPSLSQEFLSDYNKLAREFDDIVQDLFQGPKLERLTKSFLDKHGHYMNGFAFTVKTSKYPQCSTNETYDEELRMLENTETTAPTTIVSDYARILADFYRRACQACYLRITFNKSRLQQEDDRREAVELGRRSIRYNPYEFTVCYWYMIALGWQLDATSNPKERTFIARVFRQAALRCIRLNPTDALAHNLLGRYYYSVAGLTWLERTVAKQLMGCKLEGTYQDSEREFRRAHELQGDWLPTGLWLARVLLAQKRPMDEVKRWIDFGLKMAVKEPSSEIERNELLELRSRLKLANS